MHVLAVVLRSGDQPPLSRAQFHRVMYAHRAHKEYVRYQESLADSDDDEGPQDEEAWLFEDLSVLAKLYARLRDREQLIELIFEVSFPAYIARMIIHQRIGNHSGLAQGHHHDLLCTTRASVPGRKHR